MVEMHEDSIGHSTIIHGTEARHWHALVDQHDLLDLYLCASRRRGPVHTRQAKSGICTDSARLDRFYSNNRGAWYEHVDFVDHDSHQTLSDHWPIVTSIILEQEQCSEMRKSTYFKYDSSYLQNKALLSKVCEAWGKPCLTQNVLSSWESAWRRVKPIMHAEKAQRKLNTTTLGERREELAHLRGILSADSNQEEQDYVAKLEHKVRTAEHREAVVWRTRSRIKWLSIGEAPTRYFFKQLKAKHARDTITMLAVSEHE
jgi:hypothetical protein